MAKAKPAPTSDGVRILHCRYVEGRSEMETLLEQERANARIAQAIYDLRTRLGLSQREFAARVGTSASVICQLEDSAYEGHSTKMLEKIAAALGQRVELQVRFVPLKAKKPSPQRQVPSRARRNMGS